MEMTPEELTKPVTELELANVMAALTHAWPAGNDIVRRLAFERDMLKSQVESLNRLLDAAMVER
jgi:hypothetical protein